MIKAKLKTDIIKNLKHKSFYAKKNDIVTIYHEVLGNDGIVCFCSTLDNFKFTTLKSNLTLL